MPDQTDDPGPYPPKEYPDFPRSAYPNSIPDVQQPARSDSEALPERLQEFQRTLIALTPHIYVTPALIGVNVLIFVLMAASGVSLTKPTIPELVRWGADFGPKTLGGEWWRLATCMFVHIGIIHIVLNMWVLAVAGPLVERMVGNVGFLLMYLVSGLCGSLASLFWNPLLVSAGASGAIFGIYGALLGLLLRKHDTIPPQALSRLRGSGFGFLFYNLIFGLTQANVDMAAHLGGLAGGFLCGIVLSQPITLEARRLRPIRNLGVIALGASLVIAGIEGVAARHDALEDLTGETVKHGNIEVAYSNGATKAEADRLGAFFAKLWGGQNQAVVHLQKASDGYIVRIPFKKEFQNDQKVLKELEFHGARISREVFEGAAVEMRACDEHLKTLFTFPARADIRYSVVKGKVEVFFAAPNEKDNAQRLANYYAPAFENAPGLISFKLVRRGETVEFHMVVRPEMLRNPEFLAGLRQDRANLARDVFRGDTVEIHLCNERFNEVQVVD